MVERPVGCADQETPLLIKKNTRLPVELNRHVCALIQERTDLSRMTNRERLQRWLPCLVKGETHTATAVNQLGGSADPICRRYPVDDAHHAPTGSLAPNRLNKAERRACTSSTSASDGSRSS